MTPTLADLEARLDELRTAPRDAGPVEWIVRRPERERREAMAEAVLDPVEGLVGDAWAAQSAGGCEGRDDQLTLVSTRLLRLIAPDPSRWELAGDQLFVDLDLSETNLRLGTQLAIGAAAVVEVTAKPHTGCQKFARRFGLAALQLVNSPLGRQLRLRGVYARVVRRGIVRLGDLVHRCQ